MDGPWKHYTKQRSQSQKASYCMIPFIQIVQNRKIHRNRGTLVVARSQGWRMGSNS